MSDTPAEIAERLTRKRARLFPILAIIFITQQGSYLSGSGSKVANVNIGAWVVLSILLLIGLATGGGWFKSREVRTLMNDETTRAHRAKAVALGFWNAMATGILLYVIAAFEPFNGRDAIHVMMTVGIASALLSFGIMERRALA